MSALLALLLLPQAQSLAANNYAVDMPMARPAAAPRWADEFDGTAVDRGKWRFDTSRNKQGWYNNELQYYGAGRPENVRLENGRLVIEARRETLSPARHPDWGGQRYTSAKLVSTAGWRYGFYEVRAKLPCAGGTWPAIWMLPDGGPWPLAGEIDIMEHIGAKPNVVHATLHTGLFNHARGTQRGAERRVPTSCTAFHRYQLDWRPDAITIGIDDRAMMRVANDQPGGRAAWPFTVPFHLILNLAVGGDWPGPVDDASLPQRMEVDYVRVWDGPGVSADAVESMLEVMDIAEPKSRRMVRRFDERIEAPNWTRDGRSLIYNGGGRLYRIGLDGGEPVVIDTGPRLKNNNDHGLSPDGTRLAISDQSEPDGLSRIYVMPLAGSRAPRLVAGHPVGPSYWHGWSPDGRTLAYTASRPETNDYDIYARDLAGGPERRLTTAPGLDDGPEYSPDGRYLYFNSVRSGDMRIWRMRAADGADPEQVTHDAGYRDWFPHISPDGKWITFVSFGMDVALGDHPPNRDVVIRIMPADGSAKPRVLTRLFGGQGTMNVPSWSPDSRRIAFVSYRLVR